MAAMRKAFTHENRLLVSNAENILRNAGIAVQLRNEFAGGGMGELAPFETWLELWVAEEDAERAAELLAAVQEPERPEWRCNRCAEVNDGSFDYCWNCREEAPE